MNRSLKLINIANFIYLILGMIVIYSFTNENLNLVLVSYCAGWLFSVLNLELIKKIGLVLVSFMNTTSGRVPHGPVVFLLVAKFILLGSLLGIIVFTQNVLGVHFLIGTLTILFSGLFLGVRELIYASAS